MKSEEYALSKSRDHKEFEEVYENIKNFSKYKKELADSSKLEEDV